MFKKLVIATAVLAASSSIAFAANYKGDYKGEKMAPCPTYSYTAGPYIGVSIGPIINVTSAPMAFEAFSGTLSVGWAGMLTPSFYLAGELFGQGNASIKNYSVNNASAKSTWTYGLDVIPGYMLTDYVLGYLRLGVGRAQFSESGPSGNSNNNSTAWRLGVGGQTNLYQNWDLRGEYVYNGYGSVSNVGKVQSSQFNIGVIYKFI